MENNIFYSEELHEYNSDSEVIVFEDEEYISDESIDNDNELQELLKEFGLFQDLYTFLKEKNVTAIALKYVKPRHLDEIFNGENISSKIVLEHKLGIWQNQIGIYNLRPQCENTKTNHTTLSVQPIENNISVENILMQTSQGQELINSYKETKILEKNDRTFIVHKIIQVYLENNFKFNAKICKEVAEEILELFPSELLDTYYLQDSKKQPPKGKLWDRFQGRKRFLKKLTSNKRKLPQNNSNVKNQKRQKIDEMEEICTELKYIKDSNQIATKWEQTMDYRKISLQESTLAEAVKDWPLYLCEVNSLKLVDMDFQYIFPTKKLLYNKWEKLDKCCEILFRARIKDSKSLQLLTKFEENRISLNNDNCNIYIMKLLSAILIPNTQVINGQFIKFTIANSQDAFCVETSDLNDLYTYLESPKSEPFLIVYGDDFNFKEFFVVFNKSKFQFASFLEAIEYCFKLYSLFNINFMVECDLIWSFVSKYLFEIETTTKSPVLNTFIKDINSHS